MRRLHVFALITAGATFLLIIAGGLVTSTESGLAVPDWPLSYGMLMPPMVGGVFFEHGHRMVAGTVAILTLTLMIWLLWCEPRRWVKGLGVAAFGTIILQAVLGGLTVIFLLPPAISVAHACLAQAFFCLTVTLALVTSPRWRNAQRESANEVSGRRADRGLFVARQLSLVFFVAVFIQLALGALMRHTDAGLAIPDFPLAFGRIIPPHWSPQIAVHFAHRLWALAVLAAGVLLIVSVLRGRRWGAPPGSTLDGVRGPAIVIGVVLPLQIALGALTVLSGKLVVPATAHVATGALLLATGLVLMIRLRRPTIEAVVATNELRSLASAGVPVS